MSEIAKRQNHSRESIEKGAAKLRVKYKGSGNPFYEKTSLSLSLQAQSVRIYNRRALRESPSKSCGSIFCLYNRIFSFSFPLNKYCLLNFGMGCKGTRNL